MAGFSNVYFVGGQGGYLGADGMNPIYFGIFVGDASRQWYEVRYFDRKIKPIGAVTVVIPRGPNNPLALLDSCIAFFPEYFKKCPSLEIVRAQLTNAKRMDFDMKENIPAELASLREEALPYFKKLTIAEARFVFQDLAQFRID